MPKDEKKSSKEKNKPISAIAVGLKRGHVVTKRTTQKDRPSRKKGVQGSRTKLVKEVIRDVVGYAPYERRLLELLRNGLEKRALRLAKKKLGTHLRAKRKFSEMQDTLRKIREQRMRDQEAAAQAAAQKKE